MPNTFITPQIISRLGLATLYNNFVLAGLISRDYDAEFSGAKVGDTITIRKPAIFTANVFNRAQGIVIQDADEDSMPVKLDTINDVSFAVTSEDLTMNLVDFQAQLLQPAMMALVESIDRAVANELIAAAQGAGGGGTVTAVGGDGAGVFNHAREKLTRAKMPLTERYGVLSPEATTVALATDLLVQAQQAGSTDALRQANLGRIYGIDSYETGELGYGTGLAGQADGVAFHRSAVTLVTRALQAPNGVATEQVSIDSFRGLTLRTVQSYDIVHKQDIVSIDILYGMATTRPSGAVALNFGQGS